jgi:hypothetical protein
MPSIADKAGLGPTRTVHELPNGTYRIVVQPPAFIGDFPAKSVYLTPQQYEGYLRWRNGELIQYALPDLTRQQCEVLMNGDPEFDL